jgi:L-threonylcarbamoyladenylate synthase
MPHDPNNVVRVNPQEPQPGIIKRAAEVLQHGGLVAFPTETVYGLGAHALDAAAVRKIFAAKERPEWDPFIVHVTDIAMAQTLVTSAPPVFNELAKKFWPGPLTLVVHKAAHVPDEVTARRDTVALRQPRHPVAAALLAEAQLPIAAPSANRFGRPSPTCAQHVVEDLGNRVDLILDAGPTPLGVESTVLDLTQSPPVILRPGGVSREELEAVLGPVTMAKPARSYRSVAGGCVVPTRSVGLRGPGMTAKHYAPRAAVELFEGEPSDMARQMAGRAEALRQQGRKVGAIVSEEMRDAVGAHGLFVTCFGAWGDWDSLARKLFGALRELDSQGVDVILCPLPPAEGLALALRDRLQRAAGGSSA